MINDFYDKVIRLHKNEGLIEDAYATTNIDDLKVNCNKFTLRLSKLEDSRQDLSYYNAKIIKRLKTMPNIYKEIREFNQLFRFFRKLNIKTGYIKKSETPDFIFEKDNKKFGIEVTRIYAGNDWVAEKLHNDILAYRLNGNKLLEYIDFKKYDGKIKTYKRNNEIVVKAIKDRKLRSEEIIQIKNKIFEKIRKQVDDYNKYDYNYIFAEIVFSDYKEFNEVDELNSEINYFISHLDIIWGEAEFHLILKIGNTWYDFNLKNGTTTQL